MEEHPYYFPWIQKFLTLPQGLQFLHSLSTSSNLWWSEKEVSSIVPRSWILGLQLVALFCCFGVFVQWITEGRSMLQWAGFKTLRPCPTTSPSICFLLAIQDVISQLSFPNCHAIQLAVMLSPGTYKLIFLKCKPK